MMLNGVAYPLLAVDAGGYFPGLITAPVLGVAGAVLWMRLLALTSRDDRREPRTSAEEPARLQ